MQNADFFNNVFFKVFMQLIVELKFFITTTTRVCNNNKCCKIHFEFVDNKKIFILFAFCNDIKLKIEIEFFDCFCDETIFVIFVFVVVR